MKKSQIIILGIILLSFAVGIYFYPKMPDSMASHWNFRGEVDDYIPKFWGLFLMPLVSLGMFFLFILIPKIDPLKNNIEKFRKYFDWFIVLMISFLFYIYLLTLFWNAGFRFNLSQLMMPALAILFYYCGVLIENAKRNWFIGIRTPWTLSSDGVWDKTHKLGGKLFKFAGVAAILGIFFPDHASFFVIIPVFSVTIFTLFYSYFEYKKETNKP
ncbi:MAG: SdpI family protein [Parcubacteria group bacterium]